MTKTDKGWIQTENGFKETQMNTDKRRRTRMDTVGRRQTERDRRLKMDAQRETWRENTDADGQGCRKIDADGCRQIQINEVERRESH